jgi:glutamyl/glutaminyl-tRNA synthetase
MNKSNEEGAPKLTGSIILEHSVEDFLNVCEESLETRTYLVKTTLPTVVMALDGLLKELSNRNINLNIIRKKNDIDSGEKDQPNPIFDSLNWLAQFLFRNNPSHSNIHESDYFHRAKIVCGKLEERIEQLNAEKETIRIARELAEIAEKERIEKERIARLAQIQAQYLELFATSFKIWIQSLWRKDPGELYNFEIVTRC